MRAMAKMRAGQLPGPELSTLKLALTNNMQQMSERAHQRCSGPG